jgi:hypothetical protein
MLLFALVAISSSRAVAAWITDTNLPTLASAALPTNADRPSFEDRFAAPLSAGSAALLPLKRSVTAAIEAERPAVQKVLALRWLPEEFRPSFSSDEPRVAAVTTKPAGDGVPLPRSRPAAADQMAQPATTQTTTQSVALATDRTRHPADRTLMQKLSDLMPAKLSLASFSPGGGLLNRGPDLAALGYDEATAVYDISAHSVYLPSRVVLEAHSGLGNLRDDPDHVAVHNLGATPPATYDLKPREREFHGVAALRMIPADGSDIGGRSGLLVHSFMLGPNGDSNGCISVKDYERFLKAYTDGEFTRIVVVPSMSSSQVLALQNPN